MTFCSARSWHRHLVPPDWQRIEQATELALASAPRLLAASTVFREQVRREVAELVLHDKRSVGDPEA